MKYIGFYEKYKIIPVLKLSDYKYKEIHKLRKNFYESLNINPSYLKDFHVLEFCAGSGVNSLFLLKNGIKKLKIVDFNSESIKTCTKILNKYKNKTEIINQDIYKFNTKIKFDLVICENTLPGLDDPKKILKKMIKFTKKDGFIIITCSDEISVFSEKIRGLISRIILDKKSLINATLEEKISELKIYFQTHLKQLNTQTRKVDSWIIDNLIYDEWWSKDKYFSVDDVANVLIDNLSNKSIFWQISPQFYNNYQWYKKRENHLSNKIIKSQYNKNILNFLDNKNRYQSNEFDKEIIKYIKKTNILINKKNIKMLSLKKIIYNLNKISYFLKKKSANNSTSSKIDYTILFLSEYINTGKINKKYIKNLSFWGYGTQQICIKKNI